MFKIFYILQLYIFLVNIFIISYYIKICYNIDNSRYIVSIIEIIITLIYLYIYMYSWTEVFQSSLQDMIYSVTTMLPQILLGFILFIIGWFVAGFLKDIIVLVFEKAQIDKMLQKAGVEDSLHHAGYHLKSGNFFGSLIKWFIVLLFLKMSLSVMGVTALDEFFSKLVGYIPHLFVASIVLMATSIVAKLASSLVMGGARSVDIKESRSIGFVVGVIVWIFGIMITLTELGIAEGIISLVLSGLVAMLAVAGGLAFGLGGQDFAKRTIERVEKKMRNDQ